MNKLLVSLIQVTFKLNHFSAVYKFGGSVEMDLNVLFENYNFVTIFPSASNFIQNMCVPFQAAKINYSLNTLAHI